MVELFRLTRKQNDTVRLPQYNGKPVFSIAEEGSEELPAGALGQYQVKTVVRESYLMAQGWVLTLFHFTTEEQYKIWMPEVRERDNLIMPVPQVGSRLDRAGNLWTIYARDKAYDFKQYNKMF